jgi:hypothetical protein
VTFLGECTCRRRKSLPLGQRALERLEAFTRDPRLFAQAFALGAHTRVENTSRPCELRTEPLEQHLSALAAEIHALARTPQPIQGRRGLLTPPRRVGELFLRPATLLEQRVQTLVRVLAPEQRSGAAAFTLVEARLQRRKVELRHARSERGDLGPKLFGALGGGRLKRERTKPLLHLGLDIARALHLDSHTRELQLCPVFAPLETPEPGGLVQQLPPLRRLRGEYLLDAPLADDRVHPAGEAEVGKELYEVDAPDRGAVEEVLALAPAVKTPCHGQLRIRERSVALSVVEKELDLAEVLGRPPGAAGEKDVVRLLGTELRGRK